MKSRLFVVTFVLIVLGGITAYAYSPKPAFDGDFISASEFTCGIACVSDASGEGIIDSNGNVIIDFDTRPKRICSNGLIKILGDNGKFGFFSKSGVQLTDYVYDAYYHENAKTGERSLHFPYEGGDGKSDLIPVSRNHKYGYLNSYGQEQIPLQFEYAYGFSEGIARICANGILSDYGTYTNGKYGFIKENGEILKDPDTYWVAGEFKHGYTYADYVVIDSSGNEISFGGYPVNDWDGMYFHVTDINTSATAILDIHGEIEIPFDYSWKQIHRGNFVVDSKYIKNSLNEIIYTAPEDATLSIGDAWGDFVAVRKPSGDGEAIYKIGLVDRSGKTIVPIMYESISVLGDGVIYCRDSQKNYLLDYEGVQICELNGNNPWTRFTEGLISYTDFDTMNKKYLRNPLYYPEVRVNGEVLVSDVPAEIRHSRTLLPMRVIFEALGADVVWNESARTVSASKDGISVLLTIDSQVMLRNGEEITLDMPAVIENSRTLVPVRAVSEALECDVIWNTMSHTVDICTPDETNAYGKAFSDRLHSEQHHPVEVIRTPYGTVMYNIVAAPHVSYELILIDTHGEIHNLYSDGFPRSHIFGDTQLYSLTMENDGKTLHYSTVLAKPFVSPVTYDKICDAGVYQFSVNLETMEISESVITGCFGDSILRFVPDVEDESVLSDEDIVALAGLLEVTLDVNYFYDSIVYIERNDGIKLCVGGVYGVDAQRLSESLSGRITIEFYETDYDGIPIGDVILSAEHISGASYLRRDDGTHSVQINFTDEGKQRFGDATERLIGKNIGVFINGICITAPTVNKRIDGDSCVVTGDFDYEGAQYLANQINSCSVPYGIKVYEE